MHTCDVDGVKLSYSESGAGPTVILSHGVIQDHRTWDALKDALLNDHRTICYSRRCSCPNEDRNYTESTVENNVKDLVGLIAATGGGPVDLVGQSYGGEVAAVCALQRPELVRRLVLIEPALLSMLVKDPYSSSQRMMALFRRPLALMAGMRFLRRAQRPALAALDEGNGEEALRLYVDGLEDHPNALGSYSEDLRAMMLDNVGTIREVANEFPHFTREDARRIHQPTLLVRGEQTIDLFSAVVDELHKAMPDSAVVVVPRAAHLTHLDNPRECDRAIVDFLTERGR